MLEVARAIRYEGARAKALAGLTPHLPESLLGEALEAARAIGDEGDRAKALAALANHVKKLPLSTLYPLWCKALHALGGGIRSDLLSGINNLMPVITILGQKSVAEEIMHNIKDTGQWWK